MAYKDEEKLERLIDPEAYQVFLCVSRCNMPISFASHPWFVVNKQGKISRYEICFMKNCCRSHWGHLNMDFLPPFNGIGFLNFLHRTRFRWKTKLIGIAEGGEGSPAERMARFIEESKHTYPYLEKYAFTGPNSNTYAEWILSNFPEFEGKLPDNSYGKNYRACMAR